MYIKNKTAMVKNAVAIMNTETKLQIGDFILGEADKIRNGVNQIMFYFTLFVAVFRITIILLRFYLNLLVI